MSRTTAHQPELMSDQMSYRTLPLITLLALLLTLQAAVAGDDCTVVRPVADEKQLKARLETCPDDAYLLYNTGIVFARQADWDNAVKYFQRSLEQDPLAAQNLKQLQKIYRYQAVRAYRTALDSHNPEPRKPEFEFIQPPSAEQSTSLQDNSQLEKALAHWWSRWSDTHGIKSTLPLPLYQVISVADTSKLVVHHTDTTLVLTIDPTASDYALTLEYSIP